MLPAKQERSSRKPPLTRTLKNKKILSTLTAVCDNTQPSVRSKTIAKNTKEQNLEKLTHLQFFKKTINIDGNLISLSGREFQCLGLLAHGKRVKEVARCLEISARTVESYVKSIKHKVGNSFRGAIPDLYWTYFRVAPPYLKLINRPTRRCKEKIPK